MKPGEHGSFAMTAGAIRNRRASALTIFLMLAVILSLSTGCRRLNALFEPVGGCVLSRRPIHPDVAVKVAVEEGKEGEACCLRCAISQAKQYGTKVRILWVTDYSTGRKLDPDRAIYVTGSDVNRCMHAPKEASAGRREVEVTVWDRCAPSSIAFSNPDEARAFQHEHGGVIQTFAQVIGSAKVVANR